MIKIIILLTIILKVVHSQFQSKGQCATFDSKIKFSSAKYFSGRWYLIEGFRNKRTKMAACQNFAFRYDQKYLSINESFIDMDTKKQRSYSGAAKYYKKNQPNHFRLIPGIKTLPFGAHLWVIATDYSNYGVVYICSQLEPDVKEEQVYVLSRKQTLSDYRRLDAIRVIADSHFPVKKLVPHYQRGCRYDTHEAW